ncbi:MAG: formate dehydrogenase, partial [Actinomycetota bacterium]
QGLSGSLWKAAEVCTAAGLVASVLPGRGRTKRALSSVFLIAGATAAKFAIFRAGVASARDPKATFALQRAGRGGEGATGRRAVAGPRA